MHVYVHIPFCDGACSYCAFYAEDYRERRADGFLAALNREMALRVSTPRPAQTIYVGGGSPSVLSVRELDALCRGIRRQFMPAPECEWTIEANPASLSPEKLDVMRSVGVNRLSLGVQSLDDRVLRAAGRRHNAARAHRAVEEAHAAGFTNVGVDLIAGLAGDSRSSWRDSVRAVLGWGVEHLSIYMLSVESGTALAASRQAGVIDVAGSDEQLHRLQGAVRQLASAGYERYEISNFARPGYRCRHNVACWRGEDYVGFGPAASSREGCVRRTNRASLDDYLAALCEGALPPADVETLDQATDRRERLVFMLRLLEGVSLDASDAWEPTRSHLVQEELLEYAGDHCRLTPRGLDVADAVMRELWAVA